MSFWRSRTFSRGTPSFPTYPALPRTPWSPPEQNAYFPSVWGPAPVRRTTPTRGSSRASPNAAIICETVSGRKAFRFSGRLIVIFAIPPAFR